MVMDHEVGKRICKVLDIASLEQQDTQFATFMATTFQRWNDLMGLTGPNMPSPFVTGTSVDGGWSAELITTKGNPLYTLDVMQPFVFLRTLSKRDQKLRMGPTENHDHVLIRLLAPDLGDPQSSLRELAEMNDEDGHWYLSPKLAFDLHNYHAKSSPQQQFHIPQKDVYGYLETVLDTVYGPCGPTDSFPETDDNQNCASPRGIKSWRDLDPVIGIKINANPCIQCTGWPEQAKAWPRLPDWPENGTIRDIRNGGYHLVYIQKKKNNAGLSSQFAWKISFVKAESKLMKSWNTIQKQCYLALMILNWENISSRGEICVDLLKSLMFWQCEKYPTATGDWAENNMAECLSRLLMKFRTNIKDGVFKHYFISCINLLDGIEREELDLILDTFNASLEDMDKLKIFLSNEVLEKVASLVESFSGHSDICIKNQHQRTLSMDRHLAKDGDVESTNYECYDGFGDTDEIFCIFTRIYLDSTYETFVKVNISTSKKDKMRAARSRSKFANVLVMLYVLTTAIYFCITSASTHGLLMIFMLFLVAGLLLNLGWSYRWMLCFIYSIVSIDSNWSLGWKVAHFILAFPIAKFIARMVYVFERPLEKAPPEKNQGSQYVTLTGFPVVKPGLTAPMLLLYGTNLLFLCGSQAHGLRDYWDVFIYTLANHGHFMVFYPWMELFYKDYNSLLVRLRPAVCATVWTSLFVMLMLHYGSYNSSFWPWLTMTLLVVLLCCTMCHILPTHLAVPTYISFGVMLFLPAKPLYIVMFLLYVLFCTTRFWSSSPLSRAVRVLTILCVHLCLQTTSLTAILTSVNMVFGCCMYMGALYSLYKRENSSADFSLLHRISAKLVVVTFVVGVAFLAFQNKPASTQEAFILVSAPVTAAMLLNSIESTLLCALVRAYRRTRVRPGGGNH